MQQVLFRIPIKIPGWIPDGIPIYGFGLMLFLAFVICSWLAGRRAERHGIKREHVQDLAIWLFIFGILGARVTFHIAEGVPFSQFFRIWDGGLVFYGSVIGGFFGFLLGYYFIIRKHGLSAWQLA